MGRSVGARVTTSDGRSHELRARHTLLATGGFQGSTQLREELVGPGAGSLPVRSNPHSRGGGMDLARSVGAAIGFERAGFYGHLVPSGIPFADPSDFVDLSLYFSEHALLFNLDGERFTDETLGDHLTTIALSEQPEARGLLVADSRVHRTWNASAYVEGAEALDKFALATRRGGRTGVAETLDELDLLPEEWGYDGPRIRQAIEHFNARAGAGQTLTPGRHLDAAPLDEPPFYVIETIPAITFPFCGIRIDSRARVLDATGAVIPGLLAAGSDTGGVWNRAYAGGVASAVVFGLAAAATGRRTTSLRGPLMRFGFLLPHLIDRDALDPFGESKRICRLAESLGYDFVVVGQHHFTPGYVSAPFTVLGAIAAATERLRLCTGILILPLHHPLTVAEQVAQLDEISGGRAVLGVGTGYRRYEFDALGVPYDERVARMESALTAPSQRVDGQRP